MNSVNPLVSVIVITYNSINYIKETLESIKEQSYQNIQLIISDDSSKDNTVAYCTDWLKENNHRFVNSKIIAAEKNTGIPSNCNRGVLASEGEWIKIIAGDDILLEECIAKNIAFSGSNDLIKVIISDIVHFLDDTEPKQILEVTKPHWDKSVPISAKEQYESLLISYCGNTPSFFVARSIYNEFLYDERFFFLEDHPFALNVTKRGYFIYYLEENTILYRVRNDSVFFGGHSEDKIFSNFYEKKQLFDEIYRYPYLSETRKKYEMFNYKRLHLLDKLNLNKKSALNNFIFSTTRYFNPYRYKMSLTGEL